MLKNYLLTVLGRCSEHQFGQQVIEWAILTKRVQLTYDLDTDLHTILDGGNYDRLLEAYRTAHPREFELAA